MYAVIARGDEERERAERAETEREREGGARAVAGDTQGTVMGTTTAPAIKLVVVDDMALLFLDCTWNTEFAQPAAEPHQGYGCVASVAGGRRRSGVRLRGAEKREKGGGWGGQRGRGARQRPWGPATRRGVLHYYDWLAFIEGPPPLATILATIDVRYPTTHSQAGYALICPVCGGRRGSVPYESWVVEEALTKKFLWFWKGRGWSSAHPNPHHTPTSTAHDMMRIDRSDYVGGRGGRAG